MGRSSLVFIITIIVGMMFTSIGETINWMGLGNLMATAVMGALIVFFNSENDNE